MEAWVLRKIKTPLEREHRDSPKPSPGEVVVRLFAAALNRRDFWITQGMYPGIKLPTILGSDGAGIVEQAGSDVDQQTWGGREVIINPGWSWGDDRRVQSSDFKILGMPVDGTLATHVVVPTDYLVPKPPYLDWHASAALPLAGLTAYRALFTQGELRPGMRVLITGAGGGVATMGLLFATAAGAQVYVTSSDDAKRQRATAFGAKGAYNYRDPDWHKSLIADIGGVDLVLDGAGGDSYTALLEVLAPGGRLVNYGMTAGNPPQLDLFRVFWKQLQIVGSTMGSPQDFQAMVDFVDKHRITPCVDRVVPFHQADDAIAAMREAPQFGKTVISCSP
jgi:NADPH:quinone reductase-like Zn-dependent oxidoreductase